MKATGMIRRIDELGRIVIPKELRRSMRIREGCSLEIFTDDTDIILRPFSALENLPSIPIYADILAKSAGVSCVICNREQVIAASGPGKNALSGLCVSAALDRAMSSRSEIDEAAMRTPFENSNVSLASAAKIKAGGDIIGLIATIGSSVVRAGLDQVAMFAEIIGRCCE